MELLRSVRIDSAGYKRVVRDRRASYEPLFASGVWRWRELLPPIARESIVTLDEGNVPLYESPQGAQFARVGKLAYLHLGTNPTGSFKDLGMTVAVSAAKAERARGVVCASTGNTAASMAAYAARAGLEALALVPRGRIASAKYAQIVEYGGRVMEIDGTFDDAFAQLERVSQGKFAIVNSINPNRIEGQKCAAFALLEARGWRAPDWVVMPGGNLGNASALGKGMREAFALGLVDRVPRIGVVHAADPHNTRASAIAISAPKSLERARREIADSNGSSLAVDDAAIFAAKAQIGREGIGCEPASAASLAGIRELRNRGSIDPDADVVAILTGHVLKDVAH